MFQSSVWEQGADGNQEHMSLRSHMPGTEDVKTVRRGIGENMESRMSSCKSVMKMVVLFEVELVPPVGGFSEPD